MPIGRDDFNRGRTEDSAEERILRFLEEHPYDAYLPTEIAEAIGHSSTLPIDQKNTVDKATRALDRMFFEQELRVHVHDGNILARNGERGATSRPYFAAMP